MRSGVRQARECGSACKPELAESLQQIRCRPCERRDPYPQEEVWRRLAVSGSSRSTNTRPYRQITRYGSLRSQGRQRMFGPECPLRPVQHEFRVREVAELRPVRTLKIFT